MKDFEDATLLDILRLIVGSNSRLHLTQQTAFRVYNITVKKFLSCTQKERRCITRSDPEFMAIIRDTIIERGNFKNQQEAYGKVIQITDIPRMKRGNELMWSSLGDPEPQLTDKEMELLKKLTRVTKAVLRKMDQYYPNDCAKSFPRGLKSVCMMLNTSHEDTLIELQTSNPDEFNRMAIPMITRTMVNKVATDRDLTSKKVNEMCETIIDALWNEIEVD